MKLAEARFVHQPQAVLEHLFAFRGKAGDEVGAESSLGPQPPHRLAEFNGVGAVVAAVNVLRTLHGSERPLNASEVARAAGLHRGTAYNILRHNGVDIGKRDYIGSTNLR